MDSTVASALWLSTMKIIYSMLSIGYFFIIFVRNIYGVRGESDLDAHQLKNSQDWELKPMFTVNQFGEDKVKNVELKQFYENFYTVCGVTMKNYDNLILTVNNYIQRYVSLFLTASGMFDKEEKNTDEMVTVDLEITISSEDLAYLQNFSKTKGESSVLKDLSRLDAILSKIIKRRERSYLESALKFPLYIYFVGQSIYRLLVHSNFSYFTPFLIISIVVFLMYWFLPRRSFYVYLGILFNSMIIWESLNLYTKKIKDIELELENLRLQETPEECFEANSKWYHSVRKFFTGDKCLEYQKQMKRNPFYEVSLLQCFLDTYSFYTIRFFFKILGSSIRDFTGEISALWPKPIQWVVNLPLLLCVTVIVMFSIIIIYVKRLKLSFFGTSLELGYSPVIKETVTILKDSPAIKETATNKKQGPRRIPSSRSLRVMGKSRFFRRSELDLSKKKKLYLRVFKSESAIESESSDIEEPSIARESKIGKDFIDECT